MSVRTTPAWQRVLSFAVALTLGVTSFPPLPTAWSQPPAAHAPVATAPSTQPLASLVTIPEHLGEVVEAWQPPDRAPAAVVFHLQDLHTHPEAQRHIAELIGHLHNQLGISLVAVEGADGELDIRRFLRVPDPSTREPVARLFVQEGLFTGAEYRAILHPDDVALWGAEDRGVYLEHLAAFQNRNDSGRIEAILRRLLDGLKARRATVYPDALQALIARRDAADRRVDDEAFPTYVRELVRLARTSGVGLGAYPSLELLLQSRALFDRIDTAAVERERRQLVRALWPRLTDAAREELGHLTQAVASGRVPSDRLYDRLVEWAAADGRRLVPPSDGPTDHSAQEFLGALAAGLLGFRQGGYRNLRRYILYLRLVRQLHSPQVGRELDQLHEAIEAAHLTSPHQRALAELLKRTRVLDDLLAVRLTPDQHAAYQARREAFAANALWTLLTDVMGAELPVTREALEELMAAVPLRERFYRLALERDAALAGNTMRRIRETGQPAAVLIAGGFHTPGITRRLREEGVAYLVVTPTVTTPIDQTGYHDRLQGVLPPLAKLERQLDRQMLVPALASDPDNQATYRTTLLYWLALNARAWLRGSRQALASLPNWFQAQQDLGVTLTEASETRLTLASGPQTVTIDVGASISSPPADRQQAAEPDQELTRRQFNRGAFATLVGLAAGWWPKPAAGTGGREAPGPATINPVGSPSNAIDYEGLFRPFDQETYEAFAKDDQSWGYLFAGMSYQEYLRDYAQTAPYAARVKAQIIRVLEQVKDYPQVGPKLEQLIRDGLKQVKYLVLTDRLPRARGGEELVGGVNRAHGVVLLSWPRLAEQLGIGRTFDWLAVSYLIHELLHIVEPSWSEVRVHDVTLHLLQPLQHFDQANFNETRYLVDLALSGDDAALRILNLDLRADPFGNLGSPLINAIDILKEQLGVAEHEIAYVRYEDITEQERDEARRRVRPTNRDYTKKEFARVMSTTRIYFRINGRPYTVWLMYHIVNMVTTGAGKPLRFGPWEGKGQELIPSLTATLAQGPGSWWKNLPARLVFGLPLAVPWHELAHVAVITALGLRIDWTRSSFWSEIHLQAEDWNRAPLWQRVLVRLAGPVANLLAGLVGVAFFGLPGQQPSFLAALPSVVTSLHLALFASDTLLSLLLKRGDVWEAIRALRPGQSAAQRSSVDKIPDPGTTSPISSESQGGPGQSGRPSLPEPHGTGVPMDPAQIAELIIQAAHMHDAWDRDATRRFVEAYPTLQQRAYVEDVLVPIARSAGSAATGWALTYLVELQRADPTLWDLATVKGVLVPIAEAAAEHAPDAFRELLFHFVQDDPAFRQLALLQETIVPIFQVVAQDQNAYSAFGVLRKFLNEHPTFREPARLHELVPFITSARGHTEAALQALADLLGEYPQLSEPENFRAVIVPIARAAGPRASEALYAVGNFPHRVVAHDSRYFARVLVPIAEATGPDTYRAIEAVSRFFHQIDDSLSAFLSDAVVASRILVPIAQAAPGRMVEVTELIAFLATYQHQLRDPATFEQVVARPLQTAGSINGPVELLVVLAALPFDNQEVIQHALAQRSLEDMQDVLERESPRVVALIRSLKERMAPTEFGQLLTRDEYVQGGGDYSFSRSDKDVGPDLATSYLEEPTFAHLRVLLAIGAWEQARMTIGASALGPRQVVEALLLNHQNAIVTQATDLILRYQGTRGILDPLVPLTDKVMLGWFTRVDIERSVRELGLQISGEALETILATQGFRFQSHRGAMLVVPIALENLLSAYRGSAEYDHAEAQYLTHAVTTAIVHYANKGGEADGTERTQAYGANAFHEFDLGLMMLEARNRRQVDRNVSLAFRYLGEPLFEYARKRTVILEHQVVAGHLQQLMRWHVTERRAKQNLSRLLGWIVQGSVRAEQLEVAIGRINEQLDILRTEAGLKEEYFHAVFGAIDPVFLQALRSRYRAGEDNSTLLRALLTERIRNVAVVAVPARNGNPARVIEHPWKSVQKTLWDYLEQEAAIREGTLYDVDVSTVTLEDLRVPRSARGPTRPDPTHFQAELKQDSPYYAPRMVWRGQRELTPEAIIAGVAAEAVSLTRDGVTVQVDRQLPAQGLSEAALGALLEQALERLKAEGQALPDRPLTLALLDQSSNLFEDHLANGLIGLNRALFTLSPTHQRTALLVGLTHELRHEALSAETDHEALEAGFTQLDVALTRQLLPSALELEDYRAALAPIVEAWGYLEAVAFIRQSRLLHQGYVDHDLAVKRVVNPSNAPLTAIYGGAGADLSNVLLSTNATTLYFVSAYAFTAQELRQALQRGEPARPDQAAEYRDRKFPRGHALSYTVEGPAEKLLDAFLIELAALGVDTSSVDVDEIEGHPQLSFAWTYPDGPAQRYTVTLIDADITAVTTYPPLLMQALRQGFDVYYQRAGYEIARTYRYPANFLTAIRPYLRPGGFFVTDDHSHDEADAQPFPIEAVVVPVPEGERLARDIRDFRERALDYDRYVGYGWDVTVRRLTRYGRGEPDDLLNADWFKAGHRSKWYHKWLHSKNVGDLAYTFAKALGLDEEWATFLYHMALLHDFDPKRPEGTRPKVPATLEVLRRDWERIESLDGRAGHSFLREALGWDEEGRRYRMAVAIIQRSEFPFATEHPNPFYQQRNTNPVDEYRKTLEVMPEADHRFVLKWGAIFSEYADKMSWALTQDVEGLTQVTQDLAQELATEGVQGMDLIALDSYEFHQSLGTRENFRHDLALGLPEDDLILREKLWELLPPDAPYRRRFETGVAALAAFRRALGGDVRNLAEAKEAGRAVEQAVEPVPADARPVDAYLLDPLYVRHDMAVKGVINARDEPLVAIYGGAGVDVSNFLLSMNATTAYFVGRYGALSMEDVQRAVADPSAVGRPLPGLGYRVDKRRLGHGVSDALRAKEEVAGALAVELRAMLGTQDLGGVAVDSDGGHPRITFEWAYAGRAPRRYTITFIDADITNSATYPQRLRSAIDGGFDLYYQRAGHAIPQAYEGAASFIAHLYAAMRPGGYFVTDDVGEHPQAILSSRFPSHQDYGGRFPVNLPVIAVPGVESLEQEIIRQKAAQAPHLVGDALHYGWHVRIRQKPVPRVTPPTWLEEHTPELNGKVILEVTAEMALSGERPEYEGRREQQDSVLARLRQVLEASAAEARAKDPSLTQEQAERAIEHELRKAAMATSVGGIGPLLPERLMAMAALGADVVGVSLLYDKVWVQKQKPQPDGSLSLALELERVTPFLRQGVLERDRTITVRLFDDRPPVEVTVWRAPPGAYGKANVYFLDIPNIADVIGGRANVVYPGGRDAGEKADVARLTQNWILGRGALALMKALGKEPDQVIMSELSAMFADPRLVEDEYADDPFFENTQVIFNDHTPLLYAHPRWDPGKLRWLKVNPRYYENIPEVWDHNLVDVTALVVNASDAVFGVSEKHGEVMRQMASLAPFKDKIQTVTNGVSSRWVAGPFEDVEAALALSDEELLRLDTQDWADDVRWLAQRTGLGEAWAEDVIRRVPLIALWTRRIVEYKRLEVLADILDDPQMREEFLQTGAVFIFGGRMHEDDTYGPWQYRRIQDAIRQDARLQGRVIFFDNYNVWEAPRLFRLAHASVMLADEGQEAAATGFMKAQRRGKLIIASRDGAVPESVKFYGQTGPEEANGFNVPYTYVPLDRHGQPNRIPWQPTAAGLLKALKECSAVFADKPALARMMRNALRQATRVSIERTAQDMLRLFAGSVRDAAREQAAYEEGAQTAEVILAQLSLSPERARETLRRLKSHTARFIWKYRHNNAEEKILRESTTESAKGLEGFLQGFRHVRAMGTVGVWSLAFHSWNHGGRGDLFEYLTTLLQDLPALEPIQNELERLSQQAQPLPPDQMEERLRLNRVAIGLAERLLQQLSAWPSTPAGGTTQIGKQAQVARVFEREGTRLLRVVAVDDAAVVLAEAPLVAEPQLPVVESIRVLRDHPDTAIREPLSALLERFERSPPDATVMTFARLVRDLGGYASHRDRLLALQELIADNAVAQFHELLEYLADAGRLRLTVRGPRLTLRLDDALLGVITVTEPDALELLETARQARGPGAQRVRRHYLIRALQRELFPDVDREFSEQMELFPARHAFVVATQALVRDELRRLHPDRPMSPEEARQALERVDAFWRDVFVPHRDRERLSVRAELQRSLDDIVGNRLAAVRTFLAAAGRSPERLPEIHPHIYETWGVLRQALNRFVPEEPEAPLSPPDAPTEGSQGSGPSGGMGASDSPGRQAAADDNRRTLQSVAQQLVDRLAQGDEEPDVPPDAFLVLGNPDLRTFLEFAAHWKRMTQQHGRAIPIVLAGGRGRGTVPLIERTLAHYAASAALDEDERARLEEALTDETVNETDVVRLILRKEGIPNELLLIEEVPSKNTAENFATTRRIIDRVVAGRPSPRIALVTHPPLLLRAQATARKIWAGTDWIPLRVQAYRLDVAALPDDELIALVGYLAGYPEAYTARYPELNAGSEFRGTQAEHNPSVVTVPLTAKDWVLLRRTQQAFAGFLAVQPVRYDPQRRALVPEAVQPVPGTEGTRSEPVSSEPGTATQVIQAFGLGEIRRVEWVSGGAGLASHPIPKVTTTQGTFGIKRLNVKSDENANFVMEYVRHLKGHGVPIPAVHKSGTDGTQADHFFVKFQQPDGGAEYYSVDEWTVGRDILRKDAAIETLRAAGRLLGYIHTHSRRVHVGAAPLLEHWSFTETLKLTTNPAAGWRGALEAQLTPEERELIGLTLDEMRELWTPDRLANVPQQAIPSDLNFGNLKFNAAGDEVIAAFDWDQARIGYRLEDFFAALVQTGRVGEGLYVGSLRDDLAEFLRGYNEVAQPRLTQVEQEALAMLFIAQVMERIATLASQLRGDPATDQQHLESIRISLRALQEVRAALLSTPGTPGPAGPSTGSGGGSGPPAGRTEAQPVPSEPGAASSGAATAATKLTFTKQEHRRLRQILRTLLNRPDEAEEMQHALTEFKVELAFDYRDVLEEGIEEFNEQEQFLFAEALDGLTVSFDAAAKVLEGHAGRATVVRLPLSTAQWVRLIDAPQERGFQVLRDANNRGVMLIIPGSAYGDISEHRASVERVSGIPSIVFGHSHPRYTDTEASSDDVENMDGLLGELGALAGIIVVLRNPAGDIDVSIRRRGESELELLTGERALQALRDLGLLRTGSSEDTRPNADPLSAVSKESRSSTDKPRKGRLLEGLQDLIALERAEPGLALSARQFAEQRSGDPSRAMSPAIAQNELRGLFQLGLLDRTRDGRAYQYRLADWFRQALARAPPEWVLPELPDLAIWRLTPGTRQKAEQAVSQLREALNVGRGAHELVEALTQAWPAVFTASMEPNGVRLRSNAGFLKHLQGAIAPMTDPQTGAQVSNNPFRRIALEALVELIRQDYFTRDDLDGTLLRQLRQRLDDRSASIRGLAAHAIGLLIAKGLVDRQDVRGIRSKPVPLEPGTVNPVSDTKRDRVSDTGTVLLQSAPQGSYPTVDPSHEHVRALLDNAMSYLAPDNEITDPSSGYPFEGWNHEPERGLDLRAFTQLTAIGFWVEVLADIIAGHTEHPFVTREQAQQMLSLTMKSLRQDQDDPQLGDRGLLVNFMGLDNGKRRSPLGAEAQKRTFTSEEEGGFGKARGEFIWQALAERGWITPWNDQEAAINRIPGYGGEFEGALAQFKEDKKAIMEILDARHVTVVFGDNANLSASVAAAIGALLPPEAPDNPTIRELRETMEAFLDQQQEGYEYLYDESAGMMRFGWNKTTAKWMGWPGAQGKWRVAYSDYLGNEFRGPTMFVVVRYGLPQSIITNLAFKIKSYLIEGNQVFTLGLWNGSAFQMLWPILHWPELRNPAWRTIFQNFMDIELASVRNRLPSFPSESYTGEGTQYAGSVGIPEITVAAGHRITHVAPLYPLGPGYMVEPKEIEELLKTNQPVIGALVTEHGPWEGYNAAQQEAIKIQTTAHTLSLILGFIGTGPDNMVRYLESQGLLKGLESLYTPGEKVNLWESPGVVRKGNPGNGKIIVSIPRETGVNLSNGMLSIRYHAEGPSDAIIGFDRKEARPAGVEVIPNEAFVRFNDTHGEEHVIQIPLPATPALAGIKEILIVFPEGGKEGGKPVPADVAITGFAFEPYEVALEAPATVSESLTSGRQAPSSEPPDPVPSEPGTASAAGLLEYKPLSTPEQVAETYEALASHEARIQFLLERYPMPDVRIDVESVPSTFLGRPTPHGRTERVGSHHYKITVMGAEDQYEAFLIWHEFQHIWLAESGYDVTWHTQHPDVHDYLFNIQNLVNDYLIERETIRRFGTHYAPIVRDMRDYELRMGMSYLLGRKTETEVAIFLLFLTSHVAVSLYHPLLADSLSAKIMGGVDDPEAGIRHPSLKEVLLTLQDLTPSTPEEYRELVANIHNILSGDSARVEGSAVLVDDEKILKWMNDVKAFWTDLRAKVSAAMRSGQSD